MDKEIFTKFHNLVGDVIVDKNFAKEVISSLKEPPKTLSGILNTCGSLIEEKYGYDHMMKVIQNSKFTVFEKQSGFALARTKAEEASAQLAEIISGLQQLERTLDSFQVACQVVEKEISKEFRGKTIASKGK